LIKLIIRRNEPVKAWLLIEAIKEETRQNIIRLLIEKGELTLTDIQKEIPKTLPTLLFHMNLLEKTGIISWRLVKRGKKNVKAYFLKEKLVKMEVDIEVFSRAVNLKQLKELVKKMIDAYLQKKKFLPRRFSINEIMEILGTDVYTATALKDYVETFEETLIEILGEKFSDKIVQLEKDPERISQQLGIDLYWSIKLLKHLKLL